MIKNKKAISAVVTTTLLILISVMAIGLIAGVIIPLIRNSLDDSANCFALRESVKVIDLGYTCAGLLKTDITIQRAMNDLEIRGIMVGITAEASSRTYELFGEQTMDGVTMYNGDEEIRIPSKGGAETYSFEFGGGKKVTLGVMTGNSKICELDSFNIVPCS